MLQQPTEEVVVVMPACEASLFKKMPIEEPRFTLRAQDLTSDVTVSFWVRAQCFMRQKIADGLSPEQAAAQLKLLVDTYFPLPASVSDFKLLEALDYSSEMGEWSPRKLAD